MHLLMVSRDFQIVNVISKYFCNYNIDFCDKSQLDIFLNHEYEMIIIDLDIERGTYYDIIKIFSKQNKDVLVLAIIEPVSKNIKLELLSMGILDYIEKPISNEMLVEKIEKASYWLRYKRWKKENTITDDN